MTKFDNDRNLGAVVSSWTTFSEIGNKPVTDKRQLTIAGGRHKMSRLCGFVFTAKDGTEFAMAFICKLRSKINRQQKKQVGGQWTIPSRWFFLTRTGQNSLGVVNKEKALSDFGFDVDKFFNSDLFATEVPKLQKTVEKGLKQARSFAESIKDPDDRILAVEEVSSIELSIPLMKEDRFEDRNYPLINYQIKEKEDMTNDIKHTTKFKITETKDPKSHSTALKITYAKTWEDVRNIIDYNDIITDIYDALSEIRDDVDGIKYIRNSNREDEWLDLVETLYNTDKNIAKALNARFNIDYDKTIITEASFDHYEWKDGSITGKGLSKMINDSSTAKQNVLDAPVRIYDRNTNAYYDIVDSHLGKKNEGLMLDIDTTKKHVMQENCLKQTRDAETKDKMIESEKNVKKRITETDGEWSIYARTLRSYDGYNFYVDVHPNHFYTQKAAEMWKKTFQEEISNSLEYWYGQTMDRHELYVCRASDIKNPRLISTSTAEFDPKYKKAWAEYTEELKNPKYNKGVGDDSVLRDYDAAMRSNKRKIDEIYALDSNKNEAEISEKELDDKIEETMKEIYK